LETYRVYAIMGRASESREKTMKASQKIITKLRERRQIEGDLRQMLEASSEVEYRAQAQRIASLGAQVIPAIVGNLDRADAQLLTAMGAVAAFLDHDEATTALRQAALQPHRTDRGRIGAMTILERFLGEPLDEELLTSLSDPEAVAISSLVDVLELAERNPSVLVEYVQGLDQQEPDVVLAVARTLRDMDSSRAVEPLRMMAQDVRAEIAEAALRALGAIRLPEAATALQTLIPIVHPELRSLAERVLRKLRFTGVEIVVLGEPESNWRALVSPVDGMGRQSVWFILEDRRTAQARFLNILLNDRLGAVETMGHTQVSILMMPPRRPFGYLHDIALPDGSGALLMQEAPFDLGRRLVLEALAHNRETQIPVAAPLRLLGPWLWGVSGGDSLPAWTRPNLTDEGVALADRSDRLLDHPAFATWTARTEATLEVAEEALRHPTWNHEVWVRRLAAELFVEPEVARVLNRRLVIMSEWLLASGDEAQSKLALAASQAMLGERPHELPLVRALARRDLELTLVSLRQKNEPLVGLE
jgi:hypothetical protein